MRKNTLWIFGFVLLASIFGETQTTIKKAPCPIAGIPSGWNTYIDRIHRFCFSYPPTYIRTSKLWLEKYTNNKTYSEFLRKADREGRALRFQHKEFEDASIDVLLDDKAFDLESFVNQAPTGIESSPEPMHLGVNTFYYYGPGGAG